MYEEGIDYNGLRKSLIKEYSMTKSATITSFFKDLPSNIKNIPSMINEIPETISKMKSPAKIGLGELAASALLTGAIAGPIVYNQIQEKKRPLYQQIADESTPIGTAARLTGAGLLASSAAYAAHAALSSRQGQSNI